MTATVPQGLSLASTPEFLALVRISAIIEDTSNGAATSAWKLIALTANGTRRLDGADLGVTPGRTVVLPIVPEHVTQPVTLAPNTLWRQEFSVLCFCQFPKSVSAHFEFASSALRVLGRTFVQIIDRACIHRDQWPSDGLFYLEEPQLYLSPLDPSLAPTRFPEPSSYPIPLLDWA